MHMNRFLLASLYAILLGGVWLVACPVLFIHLMALILPGAHGSSWDWLTLLSVAALVVLTVQPGRWMRLVASVAVAGYLASVCADGWADLYIDLVTGDFLRPHVLEAALVFVSYGCCLFMNRTGTRAEAGECDTCVA
jgi:hypothetical protein